MTRAQAAQEAERLALERERNPWMCGDLINYWEAHYGDPYGQSVSETDGRSLVEVLKLKHLTAEQYQKVCNTLQEDRRFPGLRYGHAQTLYKLPEPQLEEALDWLRGHPETPSVAALREWLVEQGWRTPKVPVKRWTLEELREAREEWPEYDGDIKAEAVEEFLSWLAEEGT